jgi:hypothetical protein
MIKLKYAKWLFDKNVDSNPSNGIFILTTQGENTMDVVCGQVYNTTGTLIERFSMDTERITLDLSGYPKGIYIMKSRLEIISQRRNL